MYGMIRRMLCLPFHGRSKLAPILASLLFSAQPFSGKSLAAVIHLKNGKQIEADRVWEEGDKVRYEKDGNIYGFSMQLVRRLEVTQTNAADSIEPSDRTTPVLSKTLSIESLDEVPKAESSSPPVSILRNGKIDHRLLEVLETEARRTPQDPNRRLAYSSALLQIAAFTIQHGEQTEAIGRLQQYLSWNPDDLPPLLALGTLYLRQGKYSQAESVLSPALIRHEDSAELNYLLGNCYYLQEKNDLAGKFLKRSLELKYRPEVEGLLKKIEGENKVEDNFRQANSLHFVLKYAGQENRESLGTAILNSLENSYAELESVLDFSPRESIAVILYPDEVFRDITKTPNWVSALNDGKIRLPIKGISRVDDSLRQMLRHELTHSFIRLKTGDSCPVWLNEGLAQVLANESWRDFLPIFKKAAAENKMPALASMEGPFMALPEGLAGWAYKQSALAVEMIMKTYGVQDIQRLLDQAGKPPDFNTTLKSVLRADYSDLQKELTSYLARL